MSQLPIANTLRNPARPMSNVYMDSTNLEVNASRTIANDNYRQSFLTYALGATYITLTMPSNALIGNVLINLQFTLTGGAPDGVRLPLGYYLPRAWAYAAIQNIWWTYGGSSTINISGPSNFLRHIVECENDHKRIIMMDNAGAFLYNNNTSMNTPSPTGDNKYNGAAVIYCPHSSISAQKQMPFDTNLLNQLVTIRIDLVAASQLWRTTATSGQGGVGAMVPSMLTFTNGEFWVRKFVLIDSVASKRDLVGPNGSYSQFYYYLFPQQFVSPVIQLATQATQLSPEQAVTLNGFKNGSLQGINLAFIRDPYNYNVEAGTGATRPLASYFDTLQLTNLTLEYAGTIIWKAQYAEAASLLDLCNNTTDGTYAQDHYDVAQPAPTPLVPAVAAATRSYFYRISFGQFSEAFKHYQILQSGAEISANVMTLRFQFIDPNLTLATAANTTRNYFLHASYIYQAAIAVSGGVGEFTWMNPLPAPVHQEMAMSQ